MASVESPIPANVASQLPAAIRAAQADVEPASLEEFAVGMDGMIAWARTFDIKIENVKTLTEAYAESLGDIPADLLAYAFRTARAQHKYGMRMPLPQEIRKHITGIIADRKVVLRRLRNAQMCPVITDDGPIGTEARGQMATLFNGLSRELRSKTAAMQDNPHASAEEIRRRNDRIRERLKPEMERAEREVFGESINGNNETES